MPYKDPEKARERSRRYCEAHPQSPEYYQAYYAANAEQKKTAARDRRDALRAAVFGHYGESCACCGTTDRLTIDHVNGDGWQHRQELFGRQNVGGAMLYRWLVAQDFPEGFQVLCMPCNVSKKSGDHCRLDHRVLERT